MHFERALMLSIARLARDKKFKSAMGRIPEKMTIKK